MRRRLYLLLPLAVTLLAFVLRAYQLDYQSLWRDETDALRFATQPLTGLLGMFTLPGQNGPLFFLLLRPWLALSGHSEFALRFPSVLAGTLAVPVLYTLVSRLAGWRAALVAATLAATAPYLVWYGQDAKMYSLLTLLVPLALLLTWHAIRYGGLGRWALVYVVTTAAVYTHLLAALIVPVQLGWIALAPVPGRRRIRLMIAYPLALVLPYLPLAIWQADLLLRAQFRTGHAFVPLIDIFRVLIVTFTRGILPVAQMATVLPLLVALLAGLMLWTRAAPAPGGWDGRRIRALLLIWLLVPPVAVYLVSLRMPIFLDRYLIWAMPAFLALAALGIMAVARAWRVAGWVLLGIIVALNLGTIWRQGHQPIKSDFRAAARFISEHSQSGDAVLFQIPYVRYTYSYYAGEGYTAIDGPYTNYGMSPAEVGAAIQTGAGAAPAVWLVASEAPMWDAAGLTRTWLESNAIRTDSAEFARVEVTRYRLH